MGGTGNTSGGRVIVNTGNFNVRIGIPPGLSTGVLRTCYLSVVDHGVYANSC